MGVEDIPSSGKERDLRRFSHDCAGELPRMLGESPEK
jgi:hypothetical protein